MTMQEVLAAAGRQRGFVRRDAARLFGFSAKVQRRWIEREQWEAAGPRLIRRTGVPVDAGTVLMRAVLDAGTGAVLSHDSAAAWWGLPGFAREPVHVSRPRWITGNEPTFDIRLHEVLDLSSSQVTVLRDIPIVRPERLAFELFGSLHPARAARAVENAWSDGLLSGASLRAVFAELAGRGRAGTVNLREFIDGHPVDWTPPASNLEARFADLVARAGLGTWRRQVDVGDVTWVGRVDFLHDRLPVIVEVQSERYHTALLDKAADARRREALESAGFRVVEVPDTWLWYDTPRVLAAVREALCAAA